MKAKVCAFGLLLLVGGTMFAMQGDAQGEDALARELVLVQDHLATAPGVLGIEELRKLEAGSLASALENFLHAAADAAAVHRACSHIMVPWPAGYGATPLSASALRFSVVLGRTNALCSRGCHVYFADQQDQSDRARAWDVVVRLSHPSLSTVVGDVEAATAEASRAIAYFLEHWATERGWWKKSDEESRQLLAMSEEAWVQYGNGRQGFGNS